MAFLPTQFDLTNPFGQFPGGMPLATNVSNFPVNPQLSGTGGLPTTGDSRAQQEYMRYSSIKNLQNQGIPISQDDLDFVNQFDAARAQVGTSSPLSSAAFPLSQLSGTADVGNLPMDLNTGLPLGGGAISPDVMNRLEYNQNGGGFIDPVTGQTFSQWPGAIDTVRSPLGGGFPPDGGFRQPMGGGIGGGQQPRDLDALSDDELLALAEQNGIDISGFGIPSIEIPQSTRDLISQEFAPVRQQALQDITQAAVTGAGRRGLNLFDTPIAEPFLRNIALASSNIGGQQAGRALDVGINNRDFQENARRFQEDLNQRAFTNRLNLAGQNSQVGLGLNASRFGRTTGGQTVNPLANLQAQTGLINSGRGLIGNGLGGFF